MDHDRFHKYAKVYDPIKVGTSNGFGDDVHDNGIIRAVNSEYSVSKKVIGSARHNVFVGGLHPKTNEQSLTLHFEEVGKVKACIVIRDLITGCSKCYGFIEFERSKYVDEAVHRMNNTLLDSYKIIVDYEHERKLEGWKPRRLGGGFGGKKESGQLRFGCRNRPFINR